MNDPLERDIEDACGRWAKARGWFHRKYKGPGRRSHPDRLFIRNTVCVWIEFKRKGKEPTELQWQEINAMKAAGANVYWTDNLEGAKAILASHEGSAWFD